MTVLLDTLTRKYKFYQAVTCVKQCLDFDTAHRAQHKGNEELWSFFKVLHTLYCKDFRRLKFRTIFFSGTVFVRN